MLRGGENLPITETEEKNSGQTKSEMTEYIRSASLYLTLLTIGALILICVQDGSGLAVGRARSRRK